MLIVIEGLDASGKATQTRLLYDYLLKSGYKVKTIDFPRYYDNFWGKFIGQALNGDFGEWNKLDPHIASAFYALDRAETAPQIKKWLEDDYIVLSDRYTSASQLYQAPKIKSAKKRDKFIKWLENMEYEVLGVPRPDLVLFLDVPPWISKKLLENKSNDKKKRYSSKRKDLHESDDELLNMAYEQALRLVRRLKYFRRIVCHNGVDILPIDRIHKKILNVVAKYLPNPNLRLLDVTSFDKNS